MKKPRKSKEKCTPRKDIIEQLKSELAPVFECFSQVVFVDQDGHRFIKKGDKNRGASKKENEQKQ